MKFLSYDGLLAQIIRYIWNLFLLNVCLILCCLPVVTAGAAITAAYSVFLNSSMQSGVIGKFFHAFRENWKQATIIWLVFLAVIVLLVLDWYFLLSYSFPGSAIAIVVTAIASILCLSVASYVFPLQARFDNPIKVTMKNAVILGIFWIISGLLMGFVTLFPLITFFWNLEVFLLVIAVWIPLGCGLQIQINALIVSRVFRKVQPKEPE